MKRASTVFSIIFVLLVVLCACQADTKEPQNIEITVEYIADEGGTISGKTIQSKTTRNGNAVAFDLVRAIPNEGYIFVGWDDGRVEDWRSDLLTESKTIKANFQKLDAYLVTYVASEGGIIIGESVQHVTAGEQTSLVRAQAKSGYRFVGWDDGTIEESRNDLPNGDLTITAIFEEILYGTIKYEVQKGATIEGDTYQMEEYGKQTTKVKVIVEEGYRFMRWDDGCTDPERTDIINSEERIITAIISNGASVEYNATEGGTILGELIQKTPWGQSTSEVVAIPNEGYRFIGWSDGYKGTTRSDILEAESSTITARFKKYYIVEFTCDPTYGELYGELYQEVLEGEVMNSVTAIAKDEYDFVCWSGGENDPTIQVPIYESTTFEAYFTYKSTGLPVISINTENGVGITSKETYVNCTITVFDTEDQGHIIDAGAQIKGRGNSTWQRFDKKPYKIKFNSKQELFDNGKAKDWVLLADYIDGSLIRNYLAYEVAEELDTLRATPDCQSVEVYLNGEYRGVYLLCEQVEINKHRVEVSEDETAVDTGYLVEMDGWTDTVQVVVPDQLMSNRKYTIKAPDSDVITSEQKEFIRKYLTDCMNAIRGTDYELVKSLIDVQTFAEAYIIYELFKNPDTDYSSVYFYKDAGGKLICGPMWDFDMSIGNVNHKGNGVFKSTETLWSKDKCPWFNALLNHEEFRKLVGEKLVYYKPIITQTLSKKYDYIYEHAEAYKKNFEKWDVLGKNTWTNPSYIVDLKTWEEQVEYTRSYLYESLEYLIKYYSTN